jgi:hypothetical protein
MTLFSLVKWLLTFRRNMLPPSSESKISQKYQNPEEYNLNNAVKTSKSVGVTSSGIHPVTCGTSHYSRDNVSGESQASNATSRAETNPAVCPRLRRVQLHCFISVILYKTSRRLLRSRDETIKVTIDALTVAHSVKDR